MVRVSESEASRRFPELLDQFCAGEGIEIVRSGTAIAVMRPVRTYEIPGQSLLDALADRPSSDDDFATVVTSARERLGRPREVRWPD